MEPSFEYQGDPDFFNPCDDGHVRDDDMERDTEDDFWEERDELLAQQELEDFEQADEHFNHWNEDCDF